MNTNKQTDMPTPAEKMHQAEEKLREACREFTEAAEERYDGLALPVLLTELRQKNSGWSGGAHGVANVVEGLIREAIHAVIRRRNLDL